MQSVIHICSSDRLFLFKIVLLYSSVEFRIHQVNLQYIQKQLKKFYILSLKGICSTDEATNAMQNTLCAILISATRRFKIELFFFKSSFGLLCCIDRSSGPMMATKKASCNWKKNLFLLKFNHCFKEMGRPRIQGSCFLFEAVSLFLSHVISKALHAQWNFWGSECNSSV